jgi:transcriptional regulator with GAF, ATPase, and Fis domain
MLEVASPEQNPVDAILHHLAEKLAGLPEDQAASIAPDFERLKQLIAEQASQQEEARRQSRQAEMFSRALSEINQIIHSSLEIAEILDGAVSAAARAIGSDSAALSLRKGQRWVVSSIYQFPEDVLGSTMDDEEERHAVLAIESQAPVAISDANNDPRVNNEHMRQWGIASLLVVPVILRGRPLGVIFFNVQHGMAEFEEAHLDFAAKLAASISLAIQNADLFQSLKQGIIERERAEEALRASEKRLRVALSSLDIFVYSLDRDLRYTWV